MRAHVRAVRGRHQAEREADLALGCMRGESETDAVARCCLINAVCAVARAAAAAASSAECIGRKRSHAAATWSGLRLGFGFGFGFGFGLG